MPEITDRICKGCGRRCRRGWLRVHEQGQVQAPGANSGGQPETVYCSEKCLRTQLFDAAGNMQMVVEQQKEIDRLKDTIRKRHEDREWDDGTRRHFESVLRSILDQATTIEDVATAKDVQPGSEDGERFRIAAHNILQILKPYFQQRRRG
ncbi:hypothetical protein ACFYY2_29765 [Streptomyces sp. NPDC001822]|uniref:hypothetical protein n=1 Tax=Streptomyces sp. NPDC001822 TaxID=3364614 RepID=UPI0036A9807E